MPIVIKTCMVIIIIIGAAMIFSAPENSRDEDPSPEWITPLIAFCLSALLLIVVTA